MAMTVWKVSPVAVLLLSVGCTMVGCTMVGPDYSEPTAEVQPDWIAYESKALADSPPVESGWWSAAYQDPVLDQLIEATLAQNLSLRSAGLRVLQARQQLAITIGNRYPQQQQLTGEAERSGKSTGIDNLYSLGFNLGWEADIWGKFKRQIESAEASLDASIAAYDGVMLSLITEVAQNYLSARTLQNRLEVIRYNISIQQTSMGITTAKFEAGGTTELDVDQATTLLHNTRASAAGLEISLQQVKNALAVLLGRPPQAMSQLLVESAPIPSVPVTISLGMPQDLIRRRPDLRQAERQLAAQGAAIGVAAAELYPSFGLGGSIGTGVSTALGQGFGDLFSADSQGWSVFGLFQWNVLNYGRLKNNVRLQDAVFQQLLVDYRESVLQAQAEVENAIVAYLKSQEQLRNFQQAADAAQRAADISSEQYLDGMVDYNTVISTLRTLAGQQDQLASIQGTVTANLVDIYKSLGGGWQVHESRDPVELLPASTRQEMLDRTKAWRKVFK
jgi:NodT family efflux transporter outer membrane factor (OMF) lipoprotein